MGRLKKDYARGLATVLLVITLTAVISLPVQAATTDDLRAYLGMTVAPKNQTPIQLPKSGITKSNDSGDTESEDPNTVSLEQLNLDLAKLEGRYEQGLSSNTKATTLLVIMNSIRDTKSKIDEKGSLSTTVGDVDVSALINDSVTRENDMITEKAFGDAKYNIGDIGDSAVSPTDKLLSLLTPYGYKMNKDGTHEPKNTSIELRAPAGSNIVAQWNGKIAYIEDDKTGKYSIVTIFHGQRLYTVYHQIIPSELYVGKIVKQGDVIGTLGNTDTSENDLPNHMSYQIILDGSYIDPLLIFGERSKNIYEDWLKTSYETYTVAEGEEFYYSKSMSKINPNSGENKQNTIKGAAVVIGGYEKPDPGVVR